MNERIQVFPHGLSLGGDKFRPSLIFKDKTERYVLPIWLDELNTKFLMAQSDAQVNPISPFTGTVKLLEGLDVKLRSVYFYDVRGQSQFALIEGMHGEKSFEFPCAVEEILGLVINAGCVFMTNENVIEKSRIMNLDLIIRNEHAGISHSMSEGLH